jgi:hypothetical protein
MASRIKYGIARYNSPSTGVKKEYLIKINSFKSEGEDTQKVTMTNHNGLKIILLKSITDALLVEEVTEEFAQKIIETAEKKPEVAKTK